MKYIKHAIYVACITVFLFSIINLSGIFMEYHAGSNEYSDLTDFTYERASSGDTEWDDDLEIDFDELKNINNEFVGWVQIKDTQINYPVAKADNNNYYLHHTFYKTKNISGSVFMNCENTDADLDQNVILYGHNMKNGSMLAGIRKYIDQSYWEDHKYIQFYTRTGNHVYKIYSAYTTGASSDSYKYSFASDESFIEFLNKTKESSEYDTGVDLDVNSKILTLSTCVGDAAYRFVIHAVRIK